MATLDFWNRTLKPRVSLSEFAPYNWSTYPAFYLGPFNHLAPQPRRRIMAEPEGILIVEDNADDIFFLQRGMSKARLSEPVTFVCDGRGALQYLAASEDRSDWSLPKLILLDLSLPELSGLRVLEWLRGQARFKDIPVVVFTGMADPAYLTRAVALGAARCYTKN